MTLNELNHYFNSFLHREDFSSDISLNGIQISNSAPDQKEITKVAFAVDACEATVLKAAELKAQVLFVHHGIFWGHCQTITGSHYKRVAPFIKNDIALCAYHAPLDANEEVGNNYGIARRLGLKHLRRFGLWRGMFLGCIGELEEAVTIEELSEKLFPDGEKPVCVLPFGKKQIKRIAIVSGGGGEDFLQAKTCEADAYITGVVNHEEYHGIKESELTVISGGHYNTETIGVKLVAEKLAREKGIETVFIDIPTGL